ncbi:MAG: hypothetical protein KJ749_11070, partial [Planctomycetes bacterium]|nr:hypothetical protein [Planctomycetota bacterium]
MMQHLSMRILRLLGLLVVVALIPGQTRAAGTHRPQDPGFDGLWKQGIDLVERGRFDSALDTFRQVPSGEPLTDQVRTWLEEYSASQAARAEADRADFEKYIRYAKQRIEREEYRHALEWALAAADCTEDREAFLRADWLSDLVDHALEQAEELRAEAKWREAWGLYWPLAELFDREPRYEQLEREVLTHLRLDMIFADDNDWRDGLEKVRWEDAESALEA